MRRVPRRYPTRNQLHQRRHCRINLHRSDPKFQLIQFQVAAPGILWPGAGAWPIQYIRYAVVIKYSRPAK